MLQSQPPSLLVRREVDWAPLSRGTVNHLPAVVTTYLSSQNAAIAIQEDHLKEYDPVIVRMNPGFHSKIGKRQLVGNDLKMD